MTKTEAMMCLLRVAAGTLAEDSVDLSGAHGIQREYSEKEVARAVRVCNAGLLKAWIKLERARGERRGDYARQWRAAGQTENGVRLLEINVEHAMWIDDARALFQKQAPEVTHWVIVAGLIPWSELGKKSGGVAEANGLSSENEST